MGFDSSAWLFLSPTNMSSQSTIQTIWWLHNAVELMSPLPVQQNHIQGHKGLGQACDMLHAQKQCCCTHHTVIINASSSWPDEILLRRHLVVCKRGVWVTSHKVQPTCSMMILQTSMGTTRLSKSHSLKTTCTKTRYPGQDIMTHGRIFFSHRGMVQLSLDHKLLIGCLVVYKRCL